MNATSQLEHAMNTTILSYPGFQTLPKGIKQLLVASEAHFFDQPSAHRLKLMAATEEEVTKRRFAVLFDKGRGSYPSFNQSRKLIAVFCPAGLVAHE